MNVGDAIRELERSRRAHKAWIELNWDKPERPFHEAMVRKYDAALDELYLWPDWFPCIRGVREQIWTDREATDALLDAMGSSVDR